MKKWIRIILLLIGIYPSAIKATSCISYLGSLAESDEESVSHFISAHGEFIEKFPLEILEAMLECRDPFYLPQALSLEYLSSQKAFNVFKNIAHERFSGVERLKLFDQLLLKVNERLSYLKDRDFAEIKIARNASTVGVRKRTFELGWPLFPKKIRGPDFFPIPHSENVAMLSNDTVRIYSKQQLALKKHAPLFTIATRYRDIDDGIQAVAISPDGKWIATGHIGRNRILIYESDFKKRPREFSLPFSFLEHSHVPAIRHLTFSPDSKKLLGVSYYGDAFLIEMETKKIIKSFNSGLVREQPVFSSSGRYMAAGNLTQVGNRPPLVYLWDLNTSVKLPKVLRESPTDYYDDMGIRAAPEFANDESFILFKIFDRSQLSIWNPNDGKGIRDFKLRSGVFTAAAVNPINHQIVGFSENPVMGQVWESSRSRSISTLLGLSSKVSDKNLAISPDGELIVAAEETKILIWTALDYELLGLFELNDPGIDHLDQVSSIQEIKFSSDGKFLFVLGNKSRFAALNMEEMLR